MRRCVTGSLVFVALLSAGLWAASYWNITWLPFWPQRCTVRLTRGLLCIWTAGQSLPRAWQVDGYVSLETAWLAEGLPWLALNTLYGRVLHLPLWIPTVLFGGIATHFLRTTYRQWRYRAGHCTACGYSLEGLSVPRCPECGHCFAG